MYWAQALAKQTKDKTLQKHFKDFAESLAHHESAIIDELLAVQGNPVDLGGYYKPDDELASQAMRPSATFNRLLDAL
jgi:isocitrate dehydrogenase